VIGGYLIAYAVLLITGARLGQTHGYRRLFLLGMGVFGAASLAAGLAPDIRVLIGLRVVQGAGAALMFPQALTGIQLNFTGPRRARAISLFAVALSAGAVFGQVLGGVLVSADLAGASWRPIFLVNVPVCLAVAACARRRPAPAGADRGPGPPGGRLGPGRDAGLHRDLLRAAVHRGPVRAGGAGPKRGRLRAHPHPLGDRVRRRRPDHPPPARPA